MIALGAEEWCAVGWDAVELGVDGSNNDRTANGINTRISISIVALPVNWVDADASRGKCAVVNVSLYISFAFVFHDTMTPVSVAPSANFRPVRARKSFVTA